MCTHTVSFNNSVATCNAHTYTQIHTHTCIRSSGWLLVTRKRDVHRHIYVHIHIDMYIHAHVHIYIYIYIYLVEHENLCMYLYIYPVHVFIHVNVYCTHTVMFNTQYQNIMHTHACLQTYVTYTYIIHRHIHTYTYIRT